MTDPRVLSITELHAIAARLAAASRSVKVPRPLRTDLMLVSSLLSTLLRTGVINVPDNPQRCHRGRDSLACDRSLETDSLKLTCLKSHRDLKEGRFTPALFRCARRRCATRRPIAALQIKMAPGLLEQEVLPGALCCAFLELLASPQKYDSRILR